MKRKERKRVVTARKLPAQIWWAMIDSDNRIVGMECSRGDFFHYFRGKGDRIARIRLTEV